LPSFRSSNSEPSTATGKRTAAPVTFRASRGVANQVRSSAGDPASPIAGRPPIVSTRPPDWGSTATAPKPMTRSPARLGLDRRSRKPTPALRRRLIGLV
jgi:hypothetical protein